MKISFNKKSSKQIATLVLLIILCNTTLAQTYDWNKASQKEREKANEAYIDARIPTKTKPKTTTTVNNSKPAEVTKKTPYEQRLDDERIAEAKAFNTQLAIDKKQREDAIEAVLKKEYNKITQDALISIKNSNPYLEVIDMQHCSQYALAYSYSTGYVPPQNYVQDVLKYPLSQLDIYFKKYTTASYDSCITWLSNAQMLATTCIKQLQYLKQRFPEKTDAIDLKELYFMRYLFGYYNFPPIVLNNKKIIPRQPDCQFFLTPSYDNGNSKMTTKARKILHRFLDLTEKFPTESIENVAGKTQIGVNPFRMYANELEIDVKYRGEKSDSVIALITKLYKMTLFSKVDKQRVDAFGLEIKPIDTEFKWLAIMFFGDGPAWLKKSGTYFETLTARDWQKIAEASDLDYKYVAWAVSERKGRDVAIDKKEEKKLLMQYKNLYNASQGKFD